MAENFDESSGVVLCRTEWGQWWQTMSDVTIEVRGRQRITKRDVAFLTKTQFIDLKLFGSTIVQGELFGSIISADSVWTIEDDGKVLKIVLTKTRRTADNCWSALTKDGQFAADVWTLEEMKKKLTLQRFQAEIQGLRRVHAPLTRIQNIKYKEYIKQTPGFDFSGADITGNYANGGPAF